MVRFILASALISISSPVTANDFSSDAKRVHEIIMECGAPTMLGVPHLIDTVLDVYAKGFKEDYSVKYDKTEIRNKIANIMYDLVRDHPDSATCTFYQGTSENEATELLVVISYHAKIAEHQLRENLGLE